MNQQNGSRIKRIASSIAVKLWLPNLISMLVLFAVLWAFISMYGIEPGILQLATWLMIVAVAMLIALGGLYGMSVVRPLRQLREGASRLANGQLAHRIEIHSGDDLERLAREFNTMAESLQRNQEQLAAFAQDKARQAEQAQNRLRELTLITDISRTISSSLDLDATLNAILASVRDVVPYDLAEICLWEPDTRVLRTRAQGADPKYSAYTASAGGGVYTLEDGFTGWLARQGEPLLIEDVQTETRVRPRVDRLEFPIRAYAGVPLMIREDLVGTLELASYQPGAFTPAHITTLQAVASQAAIAIQNARLFEETHRRAEEMTALHESAVEITGQLEPERALNAIVEHATDMLRGQGGALYRVDNEKQTLSLLVSYRLRRDLTRINPRFGEGVSGQVAQKRQPLIVNDYLHWEGRITPDTDVPFTAVIGVPLIWQDELVGVLNVLSDAELRRFDENDIRLLTLFASQAAVALQNANLYEQIMRRVEETAALRETAIDIASELEPDRLLETIVRRAVALLQVNGGSLHRYNPADGTSRLVVSYNMGHDYRDVILQKGEGVAGQVLETGQPLVVNDYKTWAGRSSQFTEGNFSAVMGVPLTWQDKKLGVLTVMADAAQRSFDLNDVRMLTMFAAQAAVAIQNADLYQETRRRVAELAMLTEIGRALSSTLDVDKLLRLVYEQTQRVMHANNMFIALYDAEHDQVEFAFSVNEGEVQTGTRRSARAGLTGYIIQTHQTLFVRGADRLDRFMAEQGIALIGAPAASWIGVPMLVGDRILGVISVQHYQDAAAYDDTHRQLLEAIASQAAIALDNARMYQRTDVRLQERVRELTALASISRELNATLYPPTIFELVLDGTVRATGAEYAAIYLVDAATQTLQLRAVSGYAPSQAVTTQQIGVGIIGRAVSTGEPVVVEDVTRDPTYIAVIPEVRSEMCVPISYAGSVVGALNLESPVIGAFHEDDVNFVTALASQAAIAIGNAQRFEEQQERGELLRRRAEQLSNLFEISQAFRSNRPLENVLDDVAAAIQETVGFNVVVVSLVEGDPPMQRRVAAAGVPVALLEQMKSTHSPWARAEALLRDEFRVSQSYYFPAERREVIASLQVFETSQMPAGGREPGHWHPQDLLLVPLRGSGGQALGQISVDDPRDGRMPDRATFEMLELFANQAAVAIENNRLYSELEQRVAERTEDLRVALDQLTAEHGRVETLFRVTSELSASLDLDRVLNRALMLVAESLGAPRGSILLIDSQTDQLIHRAALGRTPNLPPGGRRTSYRRGEGLAGWVIQRQRPAIVKDIQADERWVKSATATSEYRAALAVPLMSSEDVLGALIIYHPRPDYFNQDHLRLVEAAARQVATSINNAELYRLIREQAERLGSMLRAQQEEASKSQAILEGVADGVMVANGQGRVVLFNAAAERILEARRDEIVGRPMEDLLGLYGAAGMNWLNQVHRWLLSADARAEVPSVEQRLQFENRFVNVHVAPVTMGEEYLGNVSVFRDITKEVEVDRAKTEFVSTVSHELRTPMTSIKGYADLMLLGAAGTMNEDQRRFLSIIKANADRLSVLVNDLLDISRIEGGRVELDIKPLRLEALVDQVANSLRGKVEEKGLKLFISLPLDMPTILGDRDRVIQILTNLVSNAYQYTKPGGTITVTARHTGSMVQTDVADTGIGIAKEDQAKVFERFFRSDDADVQTFAGTGLGLAIVKTLMDMLHGKIWLESDLGKGTTFSFTLPVGEDQPAEEPAPTAASQIMSFSRKNGNRRHVLVVEDDPNIAQLINHHLTEGGYAVSMVGRAEDALQAARQERPDLITLDIYLPGTDGFELLQTLKSDEATADIPVVIVSVLPDRKQGLRLGAVDYVTKPIDEALLMSTVGRVLSGAGKVLVVDDDRDTLDLLRQALTTQGFDVRTTGSGRRALQMVREDKPDLILLDLKLPGGVDGYQVLTQIRQSEDTADIPVIIITGSLTDAEVKRGKVMALGADRFMTKPVEINDLIAEIRQFLGEDQAAAQPASQTSE
jgi:PAS domain S-box-containing protein